MARKSIEERLAQLEAQRKTLKARLDKQERAEDTRRKLLIGALVMHRLESGTDDFSGNLSSWLRRELPRRSIRQVWLREMASGLRQNGGSVLMRPSCSAMITASSARTSSSSISIRRRSAGSIASRNSARSSSMCCSSCIVASLTDVKDERPGHGGMEGSGIAKRPPAAASGGADFCRSGGNRSGDKIGGTVRPWGLHAGMARSE